jgi:hypothetical protein
MAEPTVADDVPSGERGFVTGAVWAALERLDRPELDTHIVNNGLGNRLILTLFDRKFWINVEAEQREDPLRWEGDPHRHPGQFGGRMCHDHDDFGYHCHDLVPPPGRGKPGEAYSAAQGQDGDL